MLTNISLLSTLKALNSNSDLIDNEENASANDSRNQIRRILKSAVQPCSIGAFEELNYEKDLKRTSKLWARNNCNSPGAYEVLSSRRSQIETVKCEVHFLRDNVKKETP